MKPFIKGNIMKSKRRTIVPKKEVNRWIVFEGRVIATGYRTRKQAREAAKKLQQRPGNFKYTGRCTHGYRYITLDTHSCT